MTSLRAILRGSESARSERGSIPLALLVVIVGMGLAGLLLPMVLSQSKTTQFDTRRALSLQSAESGLDSALGLIRAAVTYDEDLKENRGDPRKLPCGPITGTVDPSTGAQFTVDIGYYTADPSGKDADWLAAQKMDCTSGYGVHYSDGSETGILVPSFILVSAAGTDGSHDQPRTLRATYVINTTNVNIDGGALPLFPENKAGAVTYCLDAGPNPKVNTVVTIQECEDPTTDRQKWSYRSNLTIRLTATIGNTSLNNLGTGLCIQSAGKGNAVTLKPCPEDKTDTNGNPVLGDEYRQIWGINNSGHFALSNSGKSDLSGDCLMAKTLGNGRNVTLETCTGGTTDPNQAFNPRPTVGSGQAGPDEPDPTYLRDKQVVNFLQFSRCIDVTNASPGLGYYPDNDKTKEYFPRGQDYLILYPCKQNPEPSAVLWNQKFTQEKVSGDKVRWFTSTGGTKYCITSPLATGTGKYVHVEACSGSKDNGQLWARYEGHLGDGADRQSLPTKQRYTMVDKNGLCLSPGPTDDMYAGNLKLVVAQCDGSLGQKWNVPPIEQNTNLTNLHEGMVAGD